jgi:hypothetical protein
MDMSARAMEATQSHAHPDILILYLYAKVGLWISSWNSWVSA